MKGRKYCLIGFHVGIPHQVIHKIAEDIGMVYHQPISMDHDFVIDCDLVRREPTNIRIKLQNTPAQFIKLPAFLDQARLLIGDEALGNHLKFAPKDALAKVYQAMQIHNLAVKPIPSCVDAELSNYCV